MPLNPNLGTSHLPKYAKYALQGGGASRELASLLDPLHRACLPPPPAHTCKETPPPPPCPPLQGGGEAGKPVGHPPAHRLPVQPGRLRRSARPHRSGCAPPSAVAAAAAALLRCVILRAECRLLCWMPGMRLLPISCPCTCMSTPARFSPSNLNAAPPHYQTPADRKTQPSHAPLFPHPAPLWPSSPNPGTSPPPCADMRSNFEAGHVCWDGRDVIGGRPTGVVRASFGYASTLGDAGAIVALVRRFFVDHGVRFDQGPRFDRGVGFDQGAGAQGAALAEQRAEAATPAEQRGEAAAPAGQRAAREQAGGRQGAPRKRGVAADAVVVRASCAGADAALAPATPTAAPSEAAAAAAGLAARALVAAAADATQALALGLDSGRAADGGGGGAGTGGSIQALWVYPIKSCRGFSPPAWPLGALRHGSPNPENMGAQHAFLPAACAHQPPAAGSGLHRPPALHPGTTLGACLVGPGPSPAATALNQSASCVPAWLRHLTGPAPTVDLPSTLSCAVQVLAACSTTAAGRWWTWPRAQPCASRSTPPWPPSQQE